MQESRMSSVELCSIQPDGDFPVGLIFTDDDSEIAEMA